MFRIIHSIFPFLHFFIFPLFAFAAGADVLGAIGGGEPDAGVISDGLVEQEEIGGEPSPDGAEGHGQREPAEGTEGALKTATGKPGPGLLRPLSPGASKALKGIKDADPKAWKEMNSKLYALDAMDRKIAEAFPDGGIDAAIQTKAELDQFVSSAGVRSLEEAGQELHEYRGFDKQILSGDIRILEQMPPEMQAGVWKMLPDLIDRWRDEESVAPFAAQYLSRLFVSTLEQCKYFSTLERCIERVEELGLDNNDVKRVHDGLTAMMKSLQGFQETASKTPESKTAKRSEDGEISEREQKVRASELALARGRVGSALDAKLRPKLMTQLKKIAGDKFSYINPNEVIRKAINEYIGPALGQKVWDAVGEYLAANDEQGALKYISQQMNDTRTTEALTKAYKVLYRSATLRSGKAPASVAGGQRPNGSATAAKQPGVTAINYNPSHTTIDYAASSKWAQELGISRQELFVSRRAVINGGKKVSWPEGATAQR